MSGASREVLFFLDPEPLEPFDLTEDAGGVPFRKAVGQDTTPLRTSAAPCMVRFMTRHDPRAAGRLARTKFAAAFMSDTKWRKLFATVAQARPDITEMVVKFIDVETPRRMRFPPDLRCPKPFMDTIEFGPTELRAIEWLELPTDLRAILEEVGKFPAAISEDHTRITGYASLIR
ncbi:MAG: hypothetical protein J7494_12915 [Sphingobium sp.]|nr:hypothetical protein [Sphingobium sp.]